MLNCPNKKAIQSNLNCTDFVMRTMDLNNYILYDINKANR